MVNLHPARDDGTVLVQAIAGVLLALVAAIALFDLGSLFIARTALMTVASDVALRAATAVDIDAIYANGVGEVLPLDPIVANERAVLTVMQITDPRLRDLRLDDVQVVGGDVRVVVSAVSPTPLYAPWRTASVRMRAAAAATVPTRL